VHLLTAVRSNSVFGATTGDLSHTVLVPGTTRALGTTVFFVTCERYREAASARLDGEPLGLSATALEHHLSICVDCAAWLETASRVGRSFRVTGQMPPDLTAAIVGQIVLPAARIGRYRRRLRLGLAVLGFVQWALAMPSLFGDNVGMAMAMHASHESAAWNLALGAAFLAVAIKPARAAGTLPVLATFVAVLAAFSVPDIAAGVVEAARLVSHAAVVAGLLLVALVSRSQRLPPPSTERTKHTEGTQRSQGAQRSGRAEVPGPADTGDRRFPRADRTA
jgi:predicted anti-sigma-YlaC factor YlaD